MIDSCISSFKQEQENKAFRLYVTEGIKYISENTAHFVEGGKYLAISYSDMIEPKEEDNRTAEEIVDDVIEKCGLKEVS